MATLPLTNHRAPAGAVVQQAILKVAQRCNLNCTYCYVYNRGDSSWENRPALISERVLRQFAVRIDEHARKHGLTSFTIELHGGEPLLFGKRRMQALVDLMRSEVRSTQIRFTMQTNGLLLDREWVELLARNEIGFGISIDGPPAHADRFRVLRSGGGSTQQLLGIIHRLRRETSAFSEWFSGCLCVINPEIDGGELVRWFVSQGFMDFDLLLPQGNYVNFPQGWTGPGPFTRFLLSAFECWYAMGSAAPRIRKFELMLSGLLGGRVYLDALGGDLRLLCVVESDGSVGVNDVARLCGGEYSNDIVNLFDHALDEHVHRYRIDEIQQVCWECRACPHFASCGGGYLPHRFNGVHFDNTSIYCEALYALSERMVEVLRADLPEQLASQLDVPEKGTPARMGADA